MTAIFSAIFLVLLCELIHITIHMYFCWFFGALVRFGVAATSGVFITFGFFVRTGCFVAFGFFVRTGRFVTFGFFVRTGSVAVGVGSVEAVATSACGTTDRPA